MREEKIKGEYFSSDLEAAKKEAIMSTEGPLLIIAGPGSGKTLTLVERIVYLISVRKVDADKIMVSTFTEKAAKELVTRVSKRVRELGLRVNLNEMYLGTLHSIFLRILEEYREYTRLMKNYRMLDQFDQNYFIYTHIREFEKVPHFNSLFRRPQLSRWQKAIFLQKYLNKIIEEVLESEKLIAASYPEMQALGHCLEVYNRLLLEENCLDFSAIQYEMLNLLESYPGVLSRIQDKIHYLMIDEYQDTNTIQERILLKLLRPAAKNICVVGDDDQGLYRFRGATIRNILEFSRNFGEGECKIISLQTNYRSHSGIIEFFNRWMSQLEWKREGKAFRFEKEIKAREGDFVDVPAVIKVAHDGEAADWHQEVYDFLMALVNRQVIEDFNQVAFLFKSVKNEKVIALAQFLETRGINIFSPRSALFFEREEIRLVLGAFIFIFPNLFEILKWEENAELEIWNYYESCKRYFADTIRTDKSAHEKLLKWCNRRARAHLQLVEATNYCFSALFYELLQFPLFSKYLDVDLNQNVTTLRAAYNLALLSKFLTKFEFLENISVFTPKIFEGILRRFFNQYLKFLKDGGIEEFEDFDDYAPSDCVSFMTIHQSKGLEFPIVLVDSLNAVPRNQFDDLDEILQNNFYHKEAFEPLDQIKFFDFWRLYYTAFSRAQNLLVLTGNENWTGRGLARLPSKYLAPVYRELISWKDAGFDMTRLKLARIKPVDIKHEYSFTSDILLYENCPLQYKFYNELEFHPVRSAATMFGILVHQTIEDIHKAILRGEEKLVTDITIENWFNLNYNSLQKIMRTYLAKSQKQVALRQVLNYKNRQAGNWDQIIEAEVDVSLVKDTYILNGTIDLIQGENETVEIVDFKSERLKPDINSPEDREKLNRYRRQLEIYAHLVEERTGYEVSRMHLYYTGEESGNPYISFLKKRAKIEETMAAFDRVVELIESKNYAMSGVEKCDKLCSNCDMRFYCGMGGV